MYGQFYILGQVEYCNSTSSCENVPGLQHTTIFIFAVFVVSLFLTPSVKCSAFYINICGFSTQPHFGQSKSVSF